MAERPVFNAYTVEKTTDKDGKETNQWFQIGAAWKHSKGEGYTIQLRALPMSASIVLRPPPEDKEEPRDTRNDNRRR